MAEAARVATRQLPAFKLGTKRVFLPEHVITLLRKEHLPPNEACFQVPLRWTKFDLRDYLWNLYNVEVRKVRSYVKELPLERRPGSTAAWYRPQPKKIMTVELAKPFQWPDVPEDADPWNKELFEQREEKTDEQRRAQKMRHDMQLPLKSKQPPSENRKELSKLARQILSGQVEWSNDVQLDPKWDTILAQAKGEAGPSKETPEMKTSKTEKEVSR